MKLADKQCVPCTGKVEKLSSEEITRLSEEVPGWTVAGGHHLTKSWSFDDFAQALAFTNRIGALAEEEGHHPDIFLTWGKVRLEIWTHAVGGLTESDFILAAKCDALPAG